MMKGKRGWIRIFEAVISVLLISSVVILLVNRNVVRVDFSSSMYNLERGVLDSIADDSSARTAVILENEPYIRCLIEERLEQYDLGFNISICPPGEACYCDSPTDEQVYVNDMIISSNIEAYSPKRIVLCCWTGKEGKQCTVASNQYCGNGIIDSAIGEQCDCGTDQICSVVQNEIPSTQCSYLSALGFKAGILACGPDCLYDMSDCKVQEQVVQPPQPPACTPSWTCSAWTPEPCAYGSTQTRTCTDSKNCGTTAGKPAESQACPTGPPAEVCPLPLPKEVSYVSGYPQNYNNLIRVKITSSKTGTFLLRTYSGTTLVNEKSLPIFTTNYMDTGVAWPSVGQNIMIFYNNVCQDRCRVESANPNTCVAY